MLLNHIKMINYNKITQLVPCLVVASVFLCFVAAQQQNQVCQVKTAKPSAKTEKYHVNQGNTNTTNACTVLQFAGYFEVGSGQYVELNNSTVSNKSSCSPDSKVVIQFDCGELAFVIGQTNDTRTFVKETTGNLHLANNTTTQYTNSTPDFYSSQKGHSYKCSSEQKRPLTLINGGNLTYSLILSNFLLEGFRNVSGTEFYQTPDECGLDSQPVSDLVRIGVGVCLVALVAIVLVAYFIGRRRWSERSSYESV